MLGMVKRMSVFVPGFCAVQVARIIRRLKVEWPGRSYNLLNRNCCHFCEDICHQLGIGPVPGWLNRFASGVEATINFADKVAISVRFVSCSHTLCSFDNSYILRMLSTLVASCCQAEVLRLSQS